MDTISIQKGKGLIGAFSSILETPIDKDGRINVPARFGQGYLQAFNFNPGLRMMVRDYQLKGKIPIKKSGPNCFTESVILLFQNISLPGAERDKLLPSVQVFPEHIDAEHLFPDITVSRSIAIAVKVAYLKELLKGDLVNEILSAITQAGQTFLFEVLLPLSIEKVSNEILRADVPVALHNFYFKVKAEELICLLFSELLKRENTNVASLSIADMQTIYKIRDSLLSLLNVPPDVSALALKANWSKSKLTRLFKQIFGTGVFQYYQALRMQEAARLLKAKKLSVSEVGYEMGFTNLSHFTRTFEKHTGMKPKKYAQSG
jgi:AraC-like DNA-binding protein